VAAAVAAVWRRGARFFVFHRTAAGLAAAMVMLVVACNFLAVLRTQQLIRETGGRGWWSDALVKFAAAIRDRSDLTVVSLDWGFNEQMEFLTDGPRVREPFWLLAFGAMPDLPRDTQHIYLAHPPEFSLSPLGGMFMQSLARENTNAVVQSWSDDQGRVAFYSITFAAP
jgi:hypothetical protein